MEMDQDEVNKILQPLVDRILPLYESGQLNKSEEDFWAARAYKTFCKEGYIDRGLFSVYLFNLVNLQPGEGIFQDAGILHAYLEGQNLELMANSDNVLRGGLTTKRIDVPELLKHVKFVPVEPAIITGKRNPTSSEEIFQTPAEDFELRKAILGKGQALKLKSNTVDIFLVADGSVVVTENDSVLNLSKGQSMLAINGASLTIKPGEMGAVVFRATVPGE
jgi:mannose-6-phosphate isomerase